MREIKFRVWDGSTMWNPETLTGDNNNTILKFYNPQKGIGWGLFDYKYDYRIASGEYNNLMQYTGLKDKNGKEIYEGDILKAYGKEITRFVVSFSNASFILYHQFGRWGLLARLFELDDMPAEIIGNIHENPELLDK